MAPYEYLDIARNLKNKFGLEADFAGSNTVAWCVNEVVKIMTRAGFKLPEKFGFEHLEKNDFLGAFSPELNKVYINSNYEEFKNLEKQNQLEESQGTFHPKTKHFLQTYIHEFSHAAHFQNLCSRFGSTEAVKLMLGYLKDHSAGEIIREPLKTTLRCCFPILNLLGIIDNVCTPNNGEYASKSLNEYFAEKNSRKIAEQLGNSYSITNVNADLVSSYHSHPSFWNFKDELKEIIKPKSFFGFVSPVISLSSKTPFIIEKCQQEIEYIDGDIYNGNIDYLKKIT